MKIIAKTNNGALIEATDDEIEAIITSVTGNTPEKIAVGQKIPAIDYAGTIQKIQALKKDYDFQRLCSSAVTVLETVEELKLAVETAAKIEL